MTYDQIYLIVSLIPGWFIFRWMQAESHNNVPEPPSQIMLLLMWISLSWAMVPFVGAYLLLQQIAKLVFPRKDV